MKKINGINVIKFIMSFFVVAIHLQPLINCSSLVKNLFDSISLCAVPFFYLVTGYFLGKKLENTSNIDSQKTIIKNERRKILKLYILFTIIYMPLTLYDYFTNNQIFIYDLFHFIRGLVLIGEHYNSWILWYLLAEYYSLLIFECSIHLKVNKKSNLLIGIVLLFVNIGIYYLNKYNVGHIMYLISKVINLIFGNGRMFSCYMYLILGAYFINSIKIRKAWRYIILLITIFTNVIVNNYIISNLLLVIDAILVFLISCEINIVNDSIADFLKFASEKIYFYHLYIWSIISFIFYKKCIYGIKIYLCTMILCIILSIIWYLIKKRGVLNEKV